jgi:multidrug efflux pump subunit AcrA (membrane-fusion protein)
VNRRFVYVLVALVIALGVLGAIFLPRHATSSPVAEHDAAPDVPLAQARETMFTLRAHAQGRVGAPQGSEAKLAFADTGIVARIDVHVGDAVVAGEVLAELDRTGVLLDAAQARSDAEAAAANYGGGSVPERALAGARARLAAARARLENLAGAKLDVDRRALERARALFAGGVLAQKDVETAQAQVTSDGADLAQARADVAQAQSDLRIARANVVASGAQAAAAQARYGAAARTVTNATLRAPADGVVVAILKHIGEAADPSGAAIVVGPVQTQTLTLVVSGDDAGRVRVGDAVAIELPAQQARGAGRVVGVVGSVDTATQTRTVIVAGVPSGAAPGDAVDAMIDVATLHGIVIPTSAVVEDPQSGKTLVFVRARGKDGAEVFTARAIDIAASNDEHTLVARGLSPGERVASQGAFDLLAPAGGG